MKLRIALWVGVVCFVACIIYGFIVLIHNKKIGKKTSFSSLVVFLIFPISEIVLVCFLCQPNIECNWLQFISFITAIILGVMGNCVLVEYLLKAHERKEIEKTHIDLLNAASLMEEMYEAEKNRNERELLDRDAFLKKIDEILSTGKAVGEESNNHLCENSFVNAVLCQKKNECIDNGVMLTTDIDIKENIGIDSLAICSVFSNLLDNAINACKVYASNNKYIRIKALMKGNMLLINVKNSADKNSKKRDRSRKHYGKQIIGEYVREYNGYYKSELNLKDKEYEVSIMMQEAEDGTDN